MERIQEKTVGSIPGSLSSSVDNLAVLFLLFLIKIFFFFFLLRGRVETGWERMQTASERLGYEHEEQQC